MRFAAALLAVIFAIGISLEPAAAAGPAGLGLHLKPCTQGKKRAAARCGTFGVYENRAAHSGRIIELNVVVLPAKHPTHRAIATIAGGPGQAATEFAPWVADGGWAWVAALRDRYDVLFMDDRGMGRSNPFPCDFAPFGDPASYFKWLFPPKLVAACRAKAASTHDFTQYHTSASVDDLNDLRAALGYEKIVLNGGSYGTFFSLVYMRRHPGSVESAVLDGVSPPGFQAVPGEPLGAQRALDDLFAKCAQDASCVKHFPHFKEHFSALMRRFDAGSIAVPVQNPKTKRVVTADLSKEVFVDQLRHVLYDPTGASYVPYVVERAYNRDYAPLGRMMNLMILGFASDINDGAFLSYSCADWMPFVTSAELAQARSGTFAGDIRYRAQQQACRQWHVPVMPASFNLPVRSDAPVLMILGSDDPATPAKYGQAGLRYLPNARAVLVKGGGHGADTPCTDKAVVAFVRARSASGLNLNACTSTFKLPAFATSMKGWPQV